MDQEIVVIVSIAGMASAAYCIVSGILYNRARKRFEQVTSEYFGVVNGAVQQATAESLADHVNLCGGCGGHFPASVIEACPGNETCPNYTNILAERSMS